MNSIDEILEEMRQGRMVILADDEDRENEGDVVLAADQVTPEAINFMARHCRGLICLTLTRERCERLRLRPMVASNGTKHGTAFTVSIEAASGIDTGISAADRARTIQAAVAPNATALDLVQPGHVFPLQAADGGVLMRAGHTEAGCDLASMAGLSPAAVICEIMNDDGTMARMPDLLEFGRKHGLKVGTIADLIRYRLRNERSIERIDAQTVQTEFGEFRLFAYEDRVHRDVHLALVRGQVDGSQPPLVRVHVADTLRDLLSVRTDPKAWTLRAALARIAKEGSGVVVILREAESPRALAEAVHALSGSGSAAPMPTAGAVEGAVLRTFGVGAQILRDLGVKQMRVLSAPKQMHGISAFDLEIVEYVE